ncbi:MAG: hypothetical protein GWP91_16160 [Rhodobacterales bacterium]|nr:hypothetical protein [Rhodobacterales bacterium]
MRPQRRHSTDLRDLNRRIASLQAALSTRTLLQTPSALVVATTQAAQIHGRRRRLYALASTAQLLTVVLLTVLYLAMDDTKVAPEQQITAPARQALPAAEPSPGVDERYDVVQTPQIDPATPPRIEASPLQPDDILIDSFPFQDERNTASSTTRRANTYACSPGIREDGPEFWYAVDVPRAGQLFASIEEDLEDGIDVDVHLLSEAHPSSCIARDNSELAIDVKPGRYWLVLDTYTGDGIEKAGSYLLTVDLK